jgi:hypothetical protein
MNLPNKAHQFKYEFDFAKAFWSELQWRAHPHLLGCHIPNEGQRSPITGLRLVQIGLVKGYFDYTFTLPDGRSAFIELKLPKKKLSEEQLLFMERLDAHPAKPPYCVAYSLDDCFQFLQQHGGLK